MRYPTEHHERPIDLSDMRALNRACRRLGRQGRRLDRPAVAPIRAARASRLLAATFALLCSMAPAAIGHAQAQDGATDLLNALNVGNLESARAGLWWRQASLSVLQPGVRSAGRRRAGAPAGVRSAVLEFLSGAQRPGRGAARQPARRQRDAVGEMVVDRRLDSMPAASQDVRLSQWRLLGIRLSLLSAEMSGDRGLSKLPGPWPSSARSTTPFFKRPTAASRTDPVLDAKGKFLRFEILGEPGDL